MNSFLKTDDFHNLSIIFFIENEYSYMIDVISYQNYLQTGKLNINVRLLIDIYTQAYMNAVKVGQIHHMQQQDISQVNKIVQEIIWGSVKFRLKIIIPSYMYSRKNYTVRKFNIFLVQLTQSVAVF